MKKINVKEIGQALVNKVMGNNEEIAEERIAVCNECPFNVAGICSECGCLLSVKKYSEFPNCPKNKWKR